MSFTVHEETKSKPSCGLGCKCTDGKHVHPITPRFKVMALTAAPRAPQHPTCFTPQRGMTDRKHSSRVAVQATSTLHTTTAEGCGCAAELKVGPMQLLSVSLSASLTGVFYTVLLSTYKYSGLHMDRGYRYESVAANRFLALWVQYAVHRGSSLRDRQFT